MDPKRPYVVGVTNTYCTELFNVAVAQLRKNGVIPSTAMVKTPAQLAQFLTDEQCALIQMFISPRPKNRSEAYNFENAEVTFVVARKGDKDLQQNDVSATHTIAELLQLPVENVLISKVGAVDPDLSPAAVTVEDDPFGGVYAGMLPQSASNDVNNNNDTTFTFEQTENMLTAGQLRKLLGVASNAAATVFATAKTNAATRVFTQEEIDAVTA